MSTTFSREFGEFTSFLYIDSPVEPGCPSLALIAVARVRDSPRMDVYRL